MAKEELNGYIISRTWFEFCANNLYTLNITSNHTAVFLYISNVWNITGQPNAFGIPTGHSALFLKISTKTYYKVIDDLVEWNFLIIKAKGKNKTTAPIFQYGNKFHSKVCSEVDSKSHLIEPKNIEPLNKEIDTKVSIKKKRASKITKRVSWAESPYVKFEYFEKEWLEVAPIITKEGEVSTDRLDIGYYYNIALNYGTNKPEKKYVNWALEAAKWAAKNSFTGEPLVFKKIIKVQFKELYSDPEPVKPTEPIQFNIPNEFK